MARKPGIRQKLFVEIEDKLRLDMILYAFWAGFWLLNGLDKFFRPTGEVIREANPVLVQGWFGIDREDKFRDYFSKLHLEELAMPSLYGFGMVEIILGATFVAILLRPGTPAMVYRLAFKMSILLFFIFSMGDILFGDRMELWEHGTFMILTLLTYQLYLSRSTEHAEVLGDFAAGADVNRDGAISTEEFDRFMDRLRTTCMVSDPAALRAPERAGSAERG